MSRNEDRLGLGIPSPNQDSTEPAEVVQEEMGLDFPNPTEFVDLPSKGKYYSEGHPLYKAEHIEINFMTAKDEDILSSKLLLKKGKAIEKFLDHIIVNKKIKSKDLFIGDKNAILIAARISGYGSNYKANSVCQHCGERSQQEFNLNEIKIKEGGIKEEDKENKDIEELPNGNYLVKLKKTRWTMEIQPLFGKDEKELTKSEELASKGKKPETPLSDQLRLMLVSIRIGENIYNDDSSLAKAVQRLPAGDSRYLRQKYGELFPSLDTTKEVECPECGVEQEVSMPIGVGFFWSK